MHLSSFLYMNTTEVKKQVIMSSKENLFVQKENRWVDFHGVLRKITHNHRVTKFFVIS